MIIRATQLFAFIGVKGSSFHCLLKSSINDTTSFICLDKRKFFSIYQRNLTDYYAAVDPSNMILIFAR